MMATAATDGNKQWCRLAWRLEALRAGFSPEVANRLAFWRWMAVQRGEHEEPRHEILRRFTAGRLLKFGQVAHP